LDNTLGNAYTAKVDSLGEVAWAKNTGYYANNASDMSYVSSDILGNVFVTGYFYSDFIKIGSQTFYNDSTYSDLFLIKYSPAGTLLWAKTLGGNMHDISCAVTSDPSGNAYILGSTLSTNLMIGGVHINENAYTGDLVNCIILLKTDSSKNINQNLISGKIINDINSNCIENTTDIAIPNCLVKLTPGDYYSMTDQNGNYSFTSDTGQFIVEEISPPYASILCPGVPGNYAFNFASVNDTSSGNNFYNTYLSNVNDLNVMLGYTRFPVPGQNFDYFVSLRNTGTTTISGTLQLFFDSTLTYTTSIPAPTVITSNKIEFSIDTIHPNENRIYLVEFLTPTTFQIGDTVISNVVVNPFLNDTTPANNFDTLLLTVHSSYDPNCKSVSPEGTISNMQELEYVVHFQNTGSSVAHNITVIDFPDRYFDMSTFRMIASSHPCMVDLSHSNKIIWTFDNIMLPDSGSNQIGSNGFVAYSIKPKTGAPISESIDNYANIYFDYNWPVVTNTTHNLIGYHISVEDHLPVQNNDVVIYPNPTRQNVTIFINENKENLQIDIFNMNGQHLLCAPMKTNMEKLDLSGFSKGMYFIRISGKNLLKYSKLIKD
jgi:hypothetical protein